jgi:hypothetical protein
MNQKMTHLKRAMALTLVGTLVLCQSFVTGTPLTQVVSKRQPFASSLGNVQLLQSNGKLPRAAHLSVQGAVMLNGFSVRNGTTVFSGSGVQTGADSAAILSFGKMGQVELTSASDFTLAVEDTTLGGQLRAGRATIVAPAGIGVKVVTVDGPILADGREATVLTVDVTDGKTQIKSSRSLAHVTTPAGTERLTAESVPEAPTGQFGGGGGGGGGGGNLMGLLGLTAGLVGLAAGLAALANDGDDNNLSPIVP